MNGVEKWIFEKNILSSLFTFQWTDDWCYASYFINGRGRPVNLFINRRIMTHVIKNLSKTFASSSIVPT